MCIRSHAIELQIDVFKQHCKKQAETRLIDMPNKTFYYKAILYAVLASLCITRNSPHNRSDDVKGKEFD